MINVPNTLSMVRIALIPVFIYVYYLPYAWSHIAATALFALGGITDWFDGYLARKLQQQSVLGAILDPLADKLMVVVVLILLVAGDPQNNWLLFSTVIIISREIFISTLREWMAKQGEGSKVAVSFAGKIKTTLQIVALSFLIFKHDFIGLPVYLIGIILLVIAAVMTLVSMINYIYAARDTIKSSV
ncbi:MAG: CDP-diacylglycerol--glycerol-3-phosphate 3-phosphatidyltransferase [Gammaproteobacteria bacterium]|nr:CDP-diacylglycerol--glycerol-3-phosphate 3-phosphatidyltransferase [Gammaproteobacteria bacterium]